MTIRHWLNRNMVGIGEAMLEFAPVGEGLYRRGFAGDTLNTCWHVAGLFGERGRVGYYTAVGTDALSDELVAFIASGRLDASRIARDPSRTLGLYVITLDGAERSFSYWREQSAARRLADDPARLDAALDGFGLIYVSGITLAIIGEAGRKNLNAALAKARAKGSLVGFDPNARASLWRDADELRRAARETMEVTDIALPSFDDEQKFWGDANSEATIERLAALGVDEIVVKNGADDIAFGVGARRAKLPTPKVEGVKDTTGAGDAFNAGYLAARLSGLDVAASCRFGQCVAAEVICCYGALAPEEAMRACRSELERAAQ